MDFINIPAKMPEENARQYAYRVLHSGIMSLDFPPGMVLVDAELSQALGVSRTPIREAIVSLVESKLVDVYPQRSSCVSRIDLKAVEEGTFLRFHTEKAILKEAVLKADVADIGKLHSNLEQQHRSLEEDKVDLYLDLDNAFHKLLYMAADKPLTWATVMRITTHQDRFRRLQVRLGSELQWPSYEVHRKIFEMIMTQADIDMEDLLYEHLTSRYRKDLPALLDQYPNFFQM
jgi:DNA-binding GntR family transcriptional regulator